MKDRSDKNVWFGFQLGQWAKCNPLKGHILNAQVLRK